MLNAPALAQAVSAIRSQAASFGALAFRSIALRHFSNFSKVRPLFAALGREMGSRYVLPDGPAALYLALDSDTAYREGNQQFFQLLSAPSGRDLYRAGGLRPVPSVIIGVHVKASRLFDLRDPAVRERLGILAETGISGAWRGIPSAPTQVLGNAVFTDGHFEGILYPSAQNPRHSCIVVFPTRLLRDSRVHFADATTNLEDQLPLTPRPRSVRG